MDVLYENFSWIQSLLDACPDIPARKRNFLEVIKKENSETVNSNLLAFFLDPEAEHGLQRLFLDSLQECIQGISTTEETWKPSITDVQGYVEITTEELTNKNGRIDLVIRGKSEEEALYYDWAIIIENKIFHHLDNDLEDYWNTVASKSKQQFGLVLSPFGNVKRRVGQILTDVDWPYKQFYHRTHEDLFRKVSARLSDHKITGNSNYLNLLNDFIDTIKNYNLPMNNDTEETRRALLQFSNNGDLIEALIRKNDELQKLVIDALTIVLAKKGFGQTSRVGNVGYHFQYASTEEVPCSSLNRFRFFFLTKELLYRNKLVGFFELHGEDFENWDVMRENIQDAFKSELEAGVTFANERTKGYQQLFYLDLPLDGIKISTSYQEQLEVLLEVNFFKNGFLQRIEKIMAQYVSVRGEI